MSMPRRIKIAASIAGIICSAAVMYSGIQKSHISEINNPAIKRGLEWRQIQNNVYGAQDNLEYRSSWTSFTYLTMSDGKNTTMIPIIHPEENPNPTYSKGYINDAITEYRSNPENKSDNPGMDSRLETIAAQLPEGVDLSFYNGKETDYSTFKKERHALNEEAETIEGIIKNYKSQIGFWENPEVIVQLSFFPGIALLAASFLSLGHSIINFDNESYSDEDRIRY